MIAVAPGDLVSQIIAPPMITNEALSSSAMSVIAHQEFEKYTDLFGYNWQQYQMSGKVHREHEFTPWQELVHRWQRRLRACSVSLPHW